MKTQAWGWLVAAVLAAGLNASYHDGGLEWAHRIAGGIEHSSNAVLALATGHADRFLAEAQILGARQETASCPLSTALARIQTRIQTRIACSRKGADNFNDSFEVMSDREEAAMARVEADQARIEAQVARMRIPAADFAPALVSLRTVACPRVRFTMPEMPRIKMPVAPVIHVDAPGAGPV
ncbi:MAG: hypothetical protein WCF26_01610 [Candidatus Sulfotelmatobacter sp.]